MKTLKIVALLIAAAATFGLCGCGGTDEYGVNVNHNTWFGDANTIAPTRTAEIPTAGLASEKFI